MATGLNLTGLQGVQKLQTILHVKAKKEPECRFHALVDKVWRIDFLTVAYIQVHQNGGVCGVDGETFADIESYGLETWLGESTGNGDVVGCQTNHGSSQVAGHRLEDPMPEVS